MGCVNMTAMKAAMMDLKEESGAKNSLKRINRKTQKLDCRRKSKQGMNIIVENIQIDQSSLTQKQKNFAFQVLKNHNLFTTLDEKQLHQIVQKMQKATVKQKQKIFEKGDSACCFFIIQEGSVEVQLDQKIMKKLYKADCFGEIALVYTCNRTASIINSSRTNNKDSQLKLIFIRSKFFKAAMKNLQNMNLEKIKKIVEKIQIFKLLTIKQKYCVLNSLVRETHKKGTILFQKGDTAHCFYIIESGKIAMKFNDSYKKDIILGQLDSFGESAFQKNARRLGMGLVVEDAVCLTINQEKMQEILGGNLSNIVYHNVKKWALIHCQELSHLQKHDIQRVSTLFQTKKVPAGQILMKEGSEIDRAFINLEGSINKLPIGTIFNLQHYNSTKPEILEESIIKNDDGAFAEIKFTVLQQGLQKKNKITMDNNSTVKSEKTEKQINLKFQDLCYIRKLGQGQFGMVHLINDKKNGKMFALKCLSKKSIKEESMEESVISERNILQITSHPLIVGYQSAYEDEYNIYFILQYIEGFEMFEAIREIGILNKTIARYYFGSILLAIEYLHSQNIIYRDIKPENSIVNCDGKVFLIDMGTAKLMKSQNWFRTDTIIGTPHYMAPQIMQGKGYSFEVDIWSLGIIFYQFICGCLPFAQDIDSPYAVYSEIIKTDLSFPDFVVDQNVIQLISKMLNKKSPQGRMKAGEQGLNWIKQNPYFQGFKWKNLQEGKMISPYIPRKYRQGKKKKQKQKNAISLYKFLTINNPQMKSQGLNIVPWINNQVK